tara:strand:- start:6189 stop:7028 length:840 start_codon:yes stop_codon:yes gene_type:complete
MIDYIVTGASGFIGKKLVRTLELKGEKVLGLCSKEFDILKISCWDELPKAKVIFHLAGKSFVPESWNYKSNIFETNINGTKNALDFCKRSKTKLIFASSYVYGIPNRLPVFETDTPKPNNPYALSKFFSEQLGEFYATYENIDFTALRIFNVFGPGQRENFLIPRIIQQVKYNDNIRVKDLKPKRDYIYIDDVANAFLLASKKMKGFKIFNIGSGTSYSVNEVIEKIQSIAGTNLPILSEENTRINEINDVIADISTTKEELSWRPKYSFIEGLKKCIN